MCECADKTTFSDAVLQEVQEVMARYPTKRAAALPLLHIAQREFRYLSDPVMQYVAGFLDINPIELKNTASFYTMFFQKEVGRHIIWVCHTLSCAILGAADILAHLEKRLGISAGHTTNDKMFTLMKAECLGSCGTGPMIQIDDEYYEDLTIERLDEILDGMIKAGRSEESA
jgi:NADH-quinone oxidoreductase subunit E